MTEAKGSSRLSLYRIYSQVQRAYSFIPYHLGRGRALPPMRYMLHFTLRCNLRCSFCFITNRAKTDELSTDEWLGVIGQTTPMSVLTVSGGEITLRRDFPVLLQACLKKGTVNFLTNGTRLDETLARTCVEGGVFMVGVSLDGLREGHDALRGKSGTFDTVVGNLERLIALRGARKRPRIDIKAMILPENLEDLPGLYRFVSRLGVDYFSLSLLKGSDLQFSPNTTDAFIPERYLATPAIRAAFDPQRFTAVYRSLLEIAGTSRTALRFNPEFSPVRGPEELARLLGFFSRANEVPVRRLYQPCYAPWVDMCVLANGDVIPCLDYKVGNVRQESLAGIWNGERFRQFRRLLRQEKILGACQTCCYCKIRPEAVS